ncbi:hypothetical protein BDZ89DRAFT_1073567 [Hymenopellis radicata]|nr:hypothetical protein BDZ89DRAFT_1073567 [Hymenopellis radicata]
MNSTSEFPQELLDEIVDWLRDDPSALIALASTAQCLRHRSQMHLFRELAVSPTTKPPSSCLLPLLQTSPHILPYVRRLRLVAGEFPSASDARKRLYVHEDQSLGQVFRSLINLDDLELMQMVRLDAFTGPSGLLPIITSPNVRKLTLNTVFLESSHSLFKVLSYFPSVTSLRLLEVHAMSAAAPLDFQTRRITELSITAGLLSSPLGVSLLDNAADGWLACLRTLTMESYFPSELPAISRIIVQERLKAEMPFFPLHRLQQLRIVLPSLNSPWLAWWIDNLKLAASVPALHLDQLMLELACPQYSTCSCEHKTFRDIGEGLTRLPNLQSVKVSVS